MHTLAPLIRTLIDSILLFGVKHTLAPLMRGILLQVTVASAGLGRGGPAGPCEALLLSSAGSVPDPRGLVPDAGGGVCPATGLFARHMRLLPGRDPVLH